MIFPLVLLVVASACLETVTESQSDIKRPNIVVILADDLGYSDLGCYGGEIETPQLDTLAANGLRFTQFYNTARCWPTRGSLLTGYYAQQIHRDKFPRDLEPSNVGGVNGKRPAWAPLLPELLQSAGYRSYHSGKWHIDGKTLAGGFDRSLNINNPGNMFTMRGVVRDDVPIKANSDDKDIYITTVTADHAISCLQEHAKQYRDRPFFQFIAFHAPHFPLHALPEDIAKYEQRYLGGWDELREQRYERQVALGITKKTPLASIEREVGPPYRFPDAFKKLGPGEVEFPVAWKELTEEQQRFQAQKMAIHAAMVDRMDQEIGRVIKQLREMDMFDNTLIVFLSDNGASAEIMVRDGGHNPEAPAGSAQSYLCLGPGFSAACNTPFRRHKTWVHEGGISTPFIVHWPAGFKARGELRSSPGHVVDVVPTVLELLEIERKGSEGSVAPPPFPGRSLATALSDDVSVNRPYLWWLHEGNRALRVGDWKVVATADKEWELYDLSKDRGEQHNLAKEMPDKLTEMTEQWLEVTTQFVQDATSP